MSEQVVVGHQPQLFPYLGILHKISRADVYVIVDHVQFVKRYFHNRSYIKVNDAPHLLTVPVLTKGHAFEALTEIRINRQGPWLDKLLKTVRLAYAKAPFFERYYAPIEAIFRKGQERLVELTSELLVFVLREYELAGDIRYSSALGVTGTRTQLLVDLTRAVGGTTYLSGAGAHAYVEPALVAAAGLKHEFNAFRHPRYPQLGRTFLEGMGCVDLLFNCGKDGRKYIVTPERYPQ